MRPAIRSLLTGGVSNPITPPCKMCASSTQIFGTVDFAKNCERYPFALTGVAVSYFRCTECELIFTDFFDDWTSQDFSDLVYNDAYILVDPQYTGSRGIAIANHFISTFRDAGRGISILDFGAGNGSFADTVRKDGFCRVIAYDPYVDGDKPEGRFDIVTAFEAVEHSITPRDTLDTLLTHMAPGGCIVVGTGMQPLNIETIRCEWWYIGPRNGHATFYSYETIRQYAKEKGIGYRGSGEGFILHDPNPSQGVSRFLSHYKPRPALVRLSAPEDDADYASWHGVEHDESGAFRWTSQSEVPLGFVDIQPEGTFVSLPIAMSITDDFMHKCFLRVGGELVRLWPRNKTLCTIIDGTRPARQHVSLVTPPTIRASELRPGDDHRSLGVAVRIIV